MPSGGIPSRQTGGVAVRWVVGTGFVLVLLVAGLLASGASAQDDTQATVQALETQVARQQATISALQTQAARSNASQQTPTPKPVPGQVSKFGQTGKIEGCSTSPDDTTNSLPKCGTWQATFDANVEVRDHIGDYSIVPQRGQFLVIWFTFTTDNHLAFPVANFKLKAGPEGQFTSTYDFAHVATVALWTTETNYAPTLLDNDTSYRIGLVFDIKPADTHFDLIYDMGGKPYPIDIVFDA